MKNEESNGGYVERVNRFVALFGYRAKQVAFYVGW